MLQIPELLAPAGDLERLRYASTMEQTLFIAACRSSVCGRLLPILRRSS